MGWYGDYTICPNCKMDNATCMFRNNMTESYYLVCTNCGLHLYAEERNWIVTNSYIDKSVIGRNREDIMDIDEIVDLEKNDNIITTGTGL